MRSCTSELKRVCSLVNAIVAPIFSWKKSKQLECHSSWVLSGWTVFLADPLTVFWQHILSSCCQVCVWDIQYHLCSAYTGVEDSESCHVSFSEMDGSSCYASWHVGRCHLTNSTHNIIISRLCCVLCSYLGIAGTSRALVLWYVGKCVYK